MDLNLDLRVHVMRIMRRLRPRKWPYQRLTQNRHGLAFLMSSSMSSTSSSISVSKKSKISADGQKSTAELFSFKNQNGDDIYGFLYRPENFDPTKTYPTICYVYGGPSVQVVRNTFELPRTKRKQFETFHFMFWWNLEGVYSSHQGNRFRKPGNYFSWCWKFRLQKKLTKLYMF